MPDKTSSTTSEMQVADNTLAISTSSAPDGTSESSTPHLPASLEDALKELEAARTALKKANAESAGHRHKAKELDELKAKLESEKLTESERLQKQLADLQKQHETVTRQSQERAVNYEVKLQAAQMGIVDPEAAAALLKWADIEYDDDGNPTNIDALLKQLLKAKPYLSGKAVVPSSGGATNPSRSVAGGRSELSWDVITKMTPEQYEARRSEIQAWLLSQPRRY